MIKITIGVRREIKRRCLQRSWRDYVRLRMKLPRTTGNLIPRDELEDAINTNKYKY
jgi:hypothetical protein